MKALLLGASSGIGRALARLLAERGESLFLIERDLTELQRSAQDLEVRGAKGKVGIAHCDLLRPDTFASALDAADQALGKFDTVIVTAGVFDTQDKLEQDIDKTLELLTVNFSHTVVFCEHVRKRLLDRGGGTLCVFSSVAGDRGRKPVSIYGASKAGLTRYLESLDHKWRKQGLVTLCVKPGFVKTAMTQGLKPPPFAGEPDQVARQVLKAIDHKIPQIYTPAAWAHIMMIIRHLPRFVMRRVDF